MSTAWEVASAILNPPVRVSRWYCDRRGCDGEPHEGWTWCEHTAERPWSVELIHAPGCRHARAQQHPYDTDWSVWLIQTGRGGGKTRAASEFVIEEVLAGRATNIALLARTPADARDVMIEGESGLINCSPDGMRPVYEPTKRKLTWPNGAEAHAYSAEAPNQMRGPQHDLAWVDEASSFQDARKGDALDTAWNNLAFTLRKAGHPRIVVTTTPKPNALTRIIREQAGEAISRWSTYDNKVNLAEKFQTDTLSRYENTRIGRQEIEGELLEDVEGALFQQWMFEDRLDGRGKRIAGRVGEAPNLVRLVVGVDPTGADSVGADECGVVVVGKGEDGHGYVLADWTLRASPHKWAEKVVEAYRHFRCDKVVAEGNFGALMVQETIQTADKGVPVEIVHASRSKFQRAEPVVSLYEQGRIHHVGPLPKTEDELLTWVPGSGWSPGRLDALVWAITWLDLAGGASAEAWREAELIRLSRTPEQEEAARHAALARKVAARSASPAHTVFSLAKCQKTPDRHHRFRESLCMACGVVKES